MPAHAPRPTARSFATRLSMRLPGRLPVRWATVLLCCILAATPARAQEIDNDIVARCHLFYTALAIQPALRRAFVDRARKTRAHLVEQVGDRAMKALLASNHPAVAGRIFKGNAFDLEGIDEYRTTCDALVTRIAER